MPITDLATNVILDNVGKVYFLKTGVYRDQVGLDNNHPLSSVSALLIHIEDGVPQNVMVANYAPSKMASWASHDFPLWYRGQVEYTITGESSPRTFAQYFTYVPSILVAMNKNGTSIMDVNVTITQSTGANLLGGFSDLTALNAEFPPTEELSDDLATAYVYDSGTKGFYRVAWNSGTSAWVWQLVNQALVTYGVQTKQYNVLPIKVQRGFAPNQTPLTVSDEVIRLIYQEIAYVNAVIANHQDLLEGLRSDVNDIDLLISEILDGTQAFTQLTLNDGNGNDVKVTYNGKDVIFSYRNITGELFKNLFLEVEPASGVTFENGMNVMYAGSIGNSGKRLAKPTILTELQVNPNLYLGMITEVTTEGHGIVNWYGEVNGLVTTGFTLGQPVYVGNNGGWVVTKPTKPLPNITVGLIERVHGTQGRISVRPNIGNYLGGLHDVYTNGHVFVGGETIKYNITNNRYEIFDLDGALSAIGSLIDDLENANMIKSIERTGTNLITITYFDDTTSTVITLSELKSFIGNATQSLAGLMSAQDKIDLDTLMALFDGDGDTVVNTIAEVLAIFENYPEGVDLVTALAGKVDKTTTIAGVNLQNNITKEELQVALDVDDKVDKVTGKSLVEDTEIAKLEDLETQAQTDAKFNLKLDKNFTSYDELTTDLSENDYIVVRDVSNNQTKKTKVSTLRGFESDTYEYGIREVVGQSASEFERVKKVNGEITYGSATGLVANVAIDGANATNSFDSVDIFNRIRENIIATDLSENSVSNTFVKVPKYYIKEEWTTEEGIDYHYYWMCSKQLVGYRLPLPFKKPDGSERDYTYMGAYEAFLDGNNKLRSLTGQIPRVSYSRNNFRTAARALDGLGVNSKYQITDLAEYVDLVQIPFMIEFATKHSQGVFAGATSMAYSASHTAIADGTAVNFIVVSNATGAAFVLGQTVSIGTSNSNDSIAKDRIVTQIDVDTPNAGETTITFDGAAVNITTGHVIASRAWKTGMTDSVKVSGTHSLNDGKHSIVWRGLENPFGNIWKNVDGVKISNLRGYVAENPKDYNDTASVGGVYAEPYLPLGYLNANANSYVQELGYDQNYPYAKFPISVQASSGLYFRDYYYQNTGDRTVFVGGLWFDSSAAGLFCWGLGNGLGGARFALGARLSYRP